MQQQLEPFSCTLVTKFERVDESNVGQGTYGQVFRGRDRDTGQIVALKLLKMQPDAGFPMTSIREIQLLQELQHPNIVSLLDVAVGRQADSVYLVFEYCEHDLSRVLDDDRIRLTESDVKLLMSELLSSVAFLHRHMVMHRDLKLSNLLIRSGHLKLADFGLARHFTNSMSLLSNDALHSSDLDAQSSTTTTLHTEESPSITHSGQVHYSPRVVTLWYRAPEVLLESEYGPAIDLWATGCILFELLTGTPLIPSSTELQAFQSIVQLLGLPTEHEWPEWPQIRDKSPLLRGVTLLQPSTPIFESRTCALSNSARSLLRAFLQYNPAHRITAAEALKHEFFTEAPLPSTAESVCRCILSRDSFFSFSRLESSNIAFQSQRSLPQNQNLKRRV